MDTETDTTYLRGYYYLLLHNDLILSSSLETYCIHTHAIGRHCLGIFRRGSWGGRESAASSLEDTTIITKLLEIQSIITSRGV